MWTNEIAHKYLLSWVSWSTEGIVDLWLILTPNREKYHLLNKLFEKEVIFFFTCPNEY